MQSVEHIVNGKELFLKPEYQAVFEAKKEFEGMCGACDSAKVQEVSEWTKTWDYREKNLAREAITVNPAKACQPLGAVMASLGFEKTMPYVHGSHGCVAYFRSYFTRHFKEPTPCVSDSMTEDAAVFGGLSNMKEGLANCKALYKPEMIAVSTTCMAEVIGDDLNAFVLSAKAESPELLADMPIPFANTPSFVGSHITGYDNMLSSIVATLTEGNIKEQKEERINIIPGFEPYLGSIREVKAIVGAFDMEFVTVADHSDQWDIPAGKYEMFSGGTTLAEGKELGNAKATISMQKHATKKTMKFVKSKFKQEALFANPIGLKGTDAFVMMLSRLSGKEVPASLRLQRGRLVDAMQDSYPYFHDKKFAIWGDPDFLLGMVAFLLEMGAEPTHVLCHNAPAGWEKEMRELLDTSPAKDKCNVWAGKDLWHMRSLLFTEPVDFMIGNSYGKELMRDTGTPLIHIGFPIFDRHHLHRYSISGYEGALNLLTWTTNKILDVMDEETKQIAKTDFFFDLIR
jgi:nitrogenase molybdenum-iron protein beta chain